MRIKEVSARIIKDSRGEETIEVLVRTEHGIFSASSPSGTSTGKYESRSFLGSVQHDIIQLENNKFDFSIEQFKDLEKIEAVIRGKIGANSLFALETSILKALAVEQGKELWQLVNEKARRMPYPVGNCIGGGLHTQLTNFTKPDFQEYLVIPKAVKFVDRVFLMNKAWETCGKILKLRKAQGKLNYEGAWATSFENEEALDVLNKVREELESSERVEIGLDMASSSFFNFTYNYKNPGKRLKTEQQLEYVKELIEKYRLGYVEDPFNEDDFDSFAKLRQDIIKSRACLIVGDDLTASHLERFRKALMSRSINSVILKPNQNGSLLEIKKLSDACKKYEIATVFSHRSGETMDYAAADLAFGLQSDFVKFGIRGKEREIKLDRLMQIEKNIER
ncbi:MAG: hypothetical protein NT076_04460 [Candidatus Pacearchaeota archaeon]|nr:hypothetical protein [Candidatus Pacearchaeota archaeon]